MDFINDFGYHHQVLAYGYEIKNGSLVKMYVYDPNQPEREDIFIEFNMDNTCRATPITHNVSIKGLPIYCFFRVNYTFNQPPEEITSASYLLSYELAPEMVKISGGNKLIPTGYYLNHYDKPAHAVSLLDFMISKTEITVGQYRQFCEKNNRSMPKEPSWGWFEGDPISHITYQDMNDYCVWLSQTTGDIYRLPTLDEWEYAAADNVPSVAAPYKNFYSGGNINEVACWRQNKPRRVASLKANKYGLYDICGNVNESVSDTRYGYQMCRGGSFICNNEVEVTLTVGGRFVEPVENSKDYYHMGFRVVKEIPSPVSVSGKIIIKADKILETMGAATIKKKSKVTLSYEISGGGFWFLTTGGKASVSDFVFDGNSWIASYSIKDCPPAPKKYYILKFDLGDLPQNSQCWTDKTFNWDLKKSQLLDLNAVVEPKVGEH